MKVSKLIDMVKGKSDDDEISVRDIVYKDGAIAACLWYEQDIVDAIAEMKECDPEEITEDDVSDVENYLSASAMESGMCSEGWGYIYEAINSTAASSMRDEKE